MGCAVRYATLQVYQSCVKLACHDRKTMKQSFTKFHDQEQPALVLLEGKGGVG